MSFSYDQYYSHYPHNYNYYYDYFYYNHDYYYYYLEIPRNLGTSKDSLGYP